jgi:hypothetical protein
VNRKHFLQTSGTVTTALLFSPGELLESPTQSIRNMNNGFKLKVLATNWGFHGTIDEYCARVKQEGYDGIEIWWPGEKKDQGDLFNALKKNALEVGFLTGAYQNNFNDHLNTFTKMVDEAANNTIQKPLYQLSFGGITSPLSRARHLLITQ